jgi:hypothetical protein
LANDVALRIPKKSVKIIKLKLRYKNIYYQKQTKNHWSRDDPAFVVLLSIGLALVAILYGILYHRNFGQILRLMFFMIFVDFVAVGVLVATLIW